jgi:parallel beta-helix repeat protein
MSLIIIFLSSFQGLIPVNQNVKSEEPTDPSEYTKRRSIIIDGNSQFTESNGVTKGNGTDSSPYIIEWWDIRDQDANPIVIKNTTANFVIKNVHIISDFFNYSGIGLVNVTNGIIEYSIIKDCLWGILVWDSRNVTVRSNVIFSNFLNNILILNSTEVRIIDTYFDSDSKKNYKEENNYGSFIDVKLEESTDISLKNNTMVGLGVSISGDNRKHWTTHHIDRTNTVNDKPIVYLKNESGGMITEQSGEIIIANCSEIFADKHSIDDSFNIIVGFSDRINVTENTASLEKESFINLKQVSNSTISGNKNFIINLRSSKSNIIQNNIVTPKFTIFSDGIDVRNSYDNKILNNTILENSIALTLWESSRNLIAGNQIFNNTYRGVYLYFSNNNTILSNHVSYTKHTGAPNLNGISLQHSNDNTMERNSIIGNSGSGISISDSSNSKITGNQVVDNIEGINIFDSFNNLIDSNTISNINYGIYISAEHNQISNNKITGNSEGIFSLSGSDNKIISNYIDLNNKININLSHNERIIISDNTISRSGIGLRLKNCQYLHVYNNDFYYNQMQLEYISNEEQNNLFNASYPEGGNYWSDLKGRDEYKGLRQDQAGTDGIADKQFEITSDVIDRYPLMEPRGPNVPIPPDFETTEENEDEAGDDITLIFLILAIIIIVLFIISVISLKTRTPINDEQEEKQKNK